MSEEEPGRSTPEAVRRVSLLDTWPDIAASIDPEQRPLAERALTAPVVSATGRELAGAMASFDHGAFNFVIVEGAVLKETTCEGRSALEVLSPGDVLAPALTPEQQTSPRAAIDYRGLEQASVAVLEGRFELIARRWPSVSAFLHERLAHQTHRASLHLAMMHIRRAEDRIVALLTDLSQRFGRTTMDGTVIDLKLTHDLMGRLIGSQRPTVSLALLELDQAGLLHRLDDGRWRMPK